MTEKIVSAAIHQGGCIISLPAPARHGTILRAMAEGLAIDPPIIGEQGFITTSGRFVNRRHALTIATEANQLRPGRAVGCPDLYSEDLW